MSEQKAVNKFSNMKLKAKAKFLKKVQKKRDRQTDGEAHVVVKRSNKTMPEQKRNVAKQRDSELVELKSDTAKIRT